MTTHTNPPPCLLWDIDGTMLDTTGLITAALEFVYQRYFGRVLPYGERRALIGIPLKVQVRVFGDLEQYGVDEDLITSDFIRYYEEHRDEERLLPNVVELVAEGKRRGIPTALVTSKNNAELANTLPRLGIADYIDDAVTADDVVNTKPDPEGILVALDRLRIAPEIRPMAVFIGDTTHDMAAARDAGIRGIGVTWGAADRKALAAERPFLIVDTDNELRRALFGRHTPRASTAATS